MVRERSKALVPVLPLRDVVVFPKMVVPLFVGRKASVRAVEAAMEGDHHLILLAQKYIVSKTGTTLSC